MQTVQHVANKAQDFQLEQPQSLFGISQAAGGTSASTRCSCALD